MRQQIQDDVCMQCECTAANWGPFCERHSLLASSICNSLKSFFFFLVNFSFHFLFNSNKEKYQEEVAIKKKSEIWKKRS